MNYTTVFLSILACCLLCFGSVHAQGESAMPFLLIGSSPEANGMASTAATQPTRDALATISNPGQLGMFTLKHLLNASTYAPSTNWFPETGFDGLTYGASAINIGYNFRELLSLPFSLSAGAGYSRVWFDYGTITVTNPGNPAGTGSFDAHETSESICAGIGLEYYVKLGLGFNFKNIESNLSPIGTEQEQGSGQAKVSATDFGMLLDVPLLGIIAGVAETSLDVMPDVSPFLDISFGYVAANHGDKVVYIDPAQADPLPRTATIGMGIELGLTSNAFSPNWKLISFRLARQADDVLVVRYPDGSSDYQTGLGDIDFVDNVILGKTNPKASVRKGWQVQVADVIYLRGGSVVGPGLAYSTSGYSICLGGLMRLLQAAMPGLEKDSWVVFMGEHFDLQYHSSKYDGTTSPIRGTTFASLNLVVKGFAF
jgi:hypothetical protein